MKKAISIALAIVLLFAGCTAPKTISDDSLPTKPESVDNSAVAASEFGAADNPDTSITTEPETVTDSAETAEPTPATSTPATATNPVSVISGNTIDLSMQSGTVEITSAGTYTLTGTLANGQILVSADKTEKVTLILSGVNITNKTGAAIYAPQCDKLTVTLAAGTQNSLTDGGSAFVYTNTADEEPNAALFCKDDLTINGTGALTVNAGFNNGIGTKDDLAIESGTFIINAANHGIRGNDSVTVSGGNFSITAGNDGIQTNNEEDATLGNIVIKSGVFKITAAHDGIQSANTLTVSGGEFDIKTGGSTSAAADTSDSYKGVKATSDINISTGTFVVSGADDAIHSNGNITIRGGDFTLASGDDGIHADGTLNVSGGNINVTKSFEGLEGANVNISAGTITVISTDDGINAAGGTNASVGGGRFGNDNFVSESLYSITISGGVITLYTNSDGIDSNGTLEVTGGTVAVFIGATREGDATDVDRGGTIAPALYGSVSIKAGTKLTVGDLWSMTLAADTTTFCLIIPGVVSGQNYQVIANGSAIGNITATTAIQGMMGGGNAGGIGGKAGGGGGGRSQR
jgi:hypothetical protein